MSSAGGRDSKDRGFFFWGKESFQAEGAEKKWGQLGFFSVSLRVACEKAESSGESQ
jgi:hypothetical protein